MFRTSDDKVSDCVDACNACANVCEWCASIALQQGKPQLMTQCIALCLDCAEVCRLAANFLIRDSRLAEAACLFSIKACETCSDECRRFKGMHFERCVARCAQVIERLETLTTEAAAPPAKPRPGRHAY